VGSRPRMPPIIPLYVHVYIHAILERMDEMWDQQTSISGLMSRGAEWPLKEYRPQAHSWRVGHSCRSAYISLRGLYILHMVHVERLSDEE
jgi:hypothetical protein